MKPSALRIERMLAKVEATLVSPPRKCLHAIVHEGDRIAGNGVRCILVESPDRFARDLTVQLTG
jgi:hypothetical protein